jgi:hypothetical protein
MTSSKKVDCGLNQIKPACEIMDSSPLVSSRNNHLKISQILKIEKME